MGIAAFSLALLSTALFVSVSRRFIETLKWEAPSVYESLGKPSLERYLWRRQLFTPYSGLILSHGYHSVLAEFPRSRRWASWLFIIHWVQVIAFSLFIGSMFFEVAAHES